jgi:hypothetical protein
MIQSRRYDLDWVRLIAFGILIYFHTAIIFVPYGLPLIQNAVSSEWMDYFVAFSSQFRLALLFLISGVGVAFARRRRDNRAFLAERSKRVRTGAGSSAVCIRRAAASGSVQRQLFLLLPEGLHDRRVPRR